MFTGIVQGIGRVEAIARHRELARVQVSRPAKWKIKPGNSVAVNGVCLTVKKVTPRNFFAELMPETLKRTTFGRGTLEAVNLESALGVGEELGGHWTTGHVDAVGKVERVSKRGPVKIFSISFPKKYAELIVPQGSIAVDGVSLTVIEAKPDSFTVSLIPYTLAKTTLGERQAEDLVNLEFDILAKYLASLVTRRK